MNPDKTMPRGCFIRHESENDGFTVVDYPTWTFGKYGKFTDAQNEPLPESVPAEKTFATRAEAEAFCREENMFVCQPPRKKPDEGANA